MSEPWKAGPEVYTTMENLIANNMCLKDLALVDDEILIVMKEKASQSGGVVVAGKTSKASNLLGVVQEKPFKFVITLAADEWQGMSDAHREALLFHHLCACGIEENPETGIIRCFVRLPDVSFFRDEVENYGFWRTSGSTPEPDMITELFGERPDPAAIAAAQAAAKKAKAQSKAAFKNKGKP